jgi:hypothetical protein
MYALRILISSLALPSRGVHHTVTPNVNRRRLLEPAGRGVCPLDPGVVPVQFWHGIVASSV